MSTVLSTPKTHLTTPTQHRFTAPTWMREPLVHFLVLGALLFAIDQLIVSREDDPRTIVIDAKIDKQAIDVFKESRGRAPNKDELYALRRVWLDNEVLYREGLALQLDRGDPAIRERVIFKALSVIDAGVKLPPFDDKSLRDWFESHRVKYDEPARYDFQEAVLAGAKTEAAAREFARALNEGKPGDAEAGLRVFNDRPHENLVQSYGAEFAAALEASPVGEWRAIPSSSGVRVMRLESVTPPQPASFENLRGVVLQDWTDATMAEQRSAAVRALAKKYTVKTEGSGE